MELKDIITLKDAGELLDLAPVSLRAAIARGRFDAAKVGTTWITTRQEVERYRSENLGQVGRPVSVTPDTARLAITAFPPTVTVAPTRKPRG